MPPDELLTQDPDRDEDELQIKPVIAEPQEQVRAEDDREGTEAEDEAAAPRPRQQHVERIGEDDLRDQQPGVGVHWRPIPTPVRIDREMAHRLDVVLAAWWGQNNRQTSRTFEEVQRCLPHDQRTDHGPERARDDRMRLDT